MTKQSSEYFEPNWLALLAGGYGLWLLIYYLQNRQFSRTPWKPIAGRRLLRAPRPTSDRSSEHVALLHVKDIIPAAPGTGHETVRLIMP